jgi:hypothetical protein
MKADEPLFEVVELRKELEGDMLAAAEKLEFEKAGALRDKIEALKKLLKADPARTQVRMSELERELYGEEGAKATPGKPGAVKRKRKRLKRTD